ncbi:MAG: shikimate dehydrogenase [Candidatus Obscuribacterales bacterium]|nr:shikimate dehydrogenase [Candidatus Obscuribacterales bacterium]
MNYLLGLIGHPISQSLSPPLHKAALSYFGLNGDYRLFDVGPSVLPQKLEQLKQDGLVGFNVTIPHKIAVYNLCQELTPQAQTVGAANTVLISSDGRMKGHNTDFMGLHDALVDLIDSRRSTACILGAGGAAKAAIRVLEKLGFKAIVVFARDLEKAAKTLGLNASGSDSKPAFAANILLKSTDVRSFDNSVDLLSDISLVTNCLPVGQIISEVPQWLRILLAEKILPETYVFDMVYSKTQLPTPLVAFANEHGLKTSDGMSMLVYQALYAFAFWTGQTPPYAVLENAFNAAKTE